MVPHANVIENSCLAPATFQVFWGVQGKSAEEYETDIQTRYGAGEVTHWVAAETVSGSGRTAAREQVYIYGTANLHRYSVLTVRVRARFDPEGWSTWSQPVNLHCFEAASPATSEQQAQPGNSPAATAVAAAVPGAPRSLQVQTAGTGELAATWQAPQSNGGAGVTGYRGPVEAGHRQLAHRGRRLLRNHHRDLVHHHRPVAGHRVRRPRHRHQQVRGRPTIRRAEGDRPGPGVIASERRLQHGGDRSAHHQRHGAGGFIYLAHKES